ncbi:uncharacterized protein LOC127278480 [Leptopilina boulardi]|uniref:uncharacterized protein LOC127278480 n=1 Tax=Leptopilina boulardi TaxID=63433 RepID=UPI0021F5438B|nr:uncharacterized protein LOC127278480 [Leptopilina boulardi]
MRPTQSTSSGHQEPAEHLIQQRTNDVAYPPLCTTASTSGGQQHQTGIKLEETSTHVKHEVLYFLDEVIDVDHDECEVEDFPENNIDFSYDDDDNYLPNDNTVNSCNSSSIAQSSQISNDDSYEYNMNDVRVLGTPSIAVPSTVTPILSCNLNKAVDDSLKTNLSQNFNEGLTSAISLQGTDILLLNNALLNFNDIPMPKTSSSIQFQPPRLASPNNSNLSTCGTIKKQNVRHYKSVNPFTSAPANACKFPRVSDIPQSILSPNEPIVPLSDKFSRKRKNADINIVKIEEAVSRSADDLHSVAINMNQTMQLKAEILRKQLEPAASDPLFRLLTHNWVQLSLRAQGEILAPALDIMEKYVDTP